jgi:polyisoprenoid-binding protein YceI
VVRLECPAAGEVDVAADPAGSNVQFTIDLASLSTGRAAWDHAFRAASPLGVVGRPLATYRSRSVTWQSSGRAAIDGVLKIGDGEPSTVPFDVSYDIDGDRASFTGAGTFPRPDSMRLPGLSYLLPRRFTLEITAVAVRV